MKRVLSSFAVLLLALALVACTSTPDDTDDSTTEIVLITDVGTIDDGSFNQGSYEGVVQYGNEFGVSYDYYRPVGEGDDAYYDEISKAITEAGAKVIVTPGYLFAIAVHRAQADFPDTSFIILDTEPHSGDYVSDVGDNTYSILYEEHQSGYLAGYAAVKDGYTKLGFAGGMRVPAVEKFGVGFVAGAEYAAKEMGVEIEIRYTYVDSFLQSPEVQQLAAGWYTSGTEVIFAAAGQANLSVFAAADAAEAKSIGVDVDQSGISDSVVTSAMKELTLSVYEALTAFYNGEFPGGTTYYYSVLDHGVGIPFASSRFTQFTEAEYDAFYELLVDDTDGIRSNIPTTHADDFSDLGLENTTIIPN